MPVIGRSIAELEVGQTATFVRAFTEDEVRAFADLTWDHNPYHTHPEFAKQARFGKPIVHGMLTAAAFTHFGGDFFPGPAILATRVEMQFLRPVLVGQPITSTAEVTQVDRERGLIVYVTTCRNPEGETVAIITCEGYPTAIEVKESSAT